MNDIFYSQNNNQLDNILVNQVFPLLLAWGYFTPTFKLFISNGLKNNKVQQDALYHISDLTHPRLIKSDKHSSRLKMFSYQCS